MNIIIRPLLSDDMSEGTGFYETMQNIAPDFKPSEVTFDDEVAFLRSNKDISKILVAIDTENNQIVGTIKMIFEAKLYHKNKFACHVEGVITRKGFEGRGIARDLISQARIDAKNKNCYKIILNCSEDMQFFYERYGFKKSGIQMRMDL